jgi:hypothetical protein
LVDQVIERVAAGKVVTNDAVKAVLADAAYHRRQTARKDREAARRSAATRKRKEAQERERLEQMERERQAAHEVKQQLIDRFGIDGVRFFLNALARDKYWAVRPLLEEAVKQHDLDRVVDPVAVEQKGAS